MASVEDLPLKYRAFVRMYRWRTIDPIPFARPRTPLTRANVALVSTAGLAAQDDPPFDPDIRGGDWSYRVIAADVDLDGLRESHRSDAWDHTGVSSDRNLALPIDRLHELKDLGSIGSVNHRHLSFMGSLTAPGRLINRSAPEAVQYLVDDQVDVVLLVPV